MDGEGLIGTDLLDLGRQHGLWDGLGPSVWGQQGGSESLPGSMFQDDRFGKEGHESLRQRFCDFLTQVSPHLGFSLDEITFDYQTIDDHLGCK